MGKVMISMILCAAFLSSFAQEKVVKDINQVCTPATALEPLRFLASDELMGRSTLRPEIHIAARYISEQFRSAGVRPFSNATDYFQPFDITLFVPAQKGYLKTKGVTYNLGSDLLQINGIKDLSMAAPIVFVGYGSQADFDKVDVRGKIVLANMGKSDSTPEAGRLSGGPRAQKVKRAIERGAVALIDRYKQSDSFWDDMRDYLRNERPWFDTSFQIPVFFLNDQKANILSLLAPGEMAELTESGNHMKNLPAENVMGWIEGTDKTLKNQFVVLSAHYDHLGISKPVKNSAGALDSIKNGARDNAIGTTCVINAARYFARYPPKRSIVLVAFTGEELVIKGSRYFADHPPVPLKQMVFNLNVDNTSYNDTTIVTLFGMGRTSADKDIQKACLRFGLTATDDPAPGENLFERSDNVSLAEKGIPAPTFSLGIKKFDDEINKYYHEVTDEVGNMNLNYALKFIKSYILSATYIADSRAQPRWRAGDKYEARWQQLFGKGGKR